MLRPVCAVAGGRQVLKEVPRREGVEGQQWQLSEWCHAILDYFNLDLDFW